MAESGRETILDVQECSGGYLECPGGVGRPSRLFGSSGRSFRMSVSGWDALLDVQEWSGDPPDVRHMLGCPPGCPGVI